MPKLNRLEQAQKKREIAKEMILGGNNNIEIVKSIKKKYGTGIGSDTLSKIRKSLDMNGNKVRRNKKDDEKIFLLQTHETSPVVKQVITQLVQVMKSEKIRSVYVTNDGNVQMSRMETVEFSV